LKKILGFLILLLGIVCILISIMGLIKAFDLFASMEASTENIGYTFGSIVFPLLLAVIGRWLFRRGLSRLRGLPHPSQKKN
jgi:multisubunit Na+/H+ antiporter MnhG subunit